MAWSSVPSRRSARLGSRPGTRRPGRRRPRRCPRSRRGGTGAMNRASDPRRSPGTTAGPYGAGRGRSSSRAGQQAMASLRPPHASRASRSSTRDRLVDRGNLGRRFRRDSGRKRRARPAGKHPAAAGSAQPRPRPEARCRTAPTAVTATSSACSAQAAFRHLPRQQPQRPPQYPRAVPGGASSGRRPSGAGRSPWSGLAGRPAPPSPRRRRPRRKRYS